MYLERALRALMEKKKWSMYVTPEFNEKLQALRAEFGMTEGALGLLLLKMGYEAFIRAYKPQLMLSSDDWKKIMEAGTGERDTMGGKQGN